MSVQPAFQPLMDELLAFVTRPEQSAELLAGRTEYVRNTGEAFEEDRSFELRMRAFLDWFVFDRPLAPGAEPPARVYPRIAGLDERHAHAFLLLSRTVHGVFELRSKRGKKVRVTNLLTSAKYEVPSDDPPLQGLSRGDLFEGRLVPFEDAWRFSGAFVFHPRVIRSLLLEELARQRREKVAEPVQEIVFTLSRMAIRAEHYRNVRIEAIYDFERPPPKVGGALLKFDRESVARRLGRSVELPAAPGPETATDSTS